MQALNNGICAQCKLEKPLAARYRSLPICAGCDDELATEGVDFPAFDCTACGKNASWLWGDFNEFGEFICRNCIPSGICRQCGGAKPLKNVRADEFGHLLLCAECVKNYDGD